MADWLLIVPGEGEDIKHPDRKKLASALRCPDPGHVKITEIGGAYFYSVAEAADDPGVVFVNREDGQACTVVASALLTEREDFTREIRSAGRRVNTESNDGELMAHAVSLWGKDAWNKPGGEFSVASWMPEKRSILLAADAEGQRPVFWGSTRRGFTASSRFEAMVHSPLISREPDRNMLLLYLTGKGVLPEECSTWLKDVKEVPSGHFLKYKQGKTDLKKWWEFPSGLLVWRPKNEAEAADRFRFTLRQSVTERIRSHKKIAIALSGGMDSTLIAATLADLRHERPDLDLMAIHAEYDPDLKSNEAKLAEEAARYLDLPFLRVPIGEVPMWPLKHTVNNWPPHHWFGKWEPFAAAASNHASAVLTGNSGEIFSRAALTDSLVMGHVKEIFTAGPRLKKLNMSFRPWSRGHWKREKWPLRDQVKTQDTPWTRSDALLNEEMKDYLGRMTDWQPDVSDQRLSFLNTFIGLQRGGSHQFDHGSKRIAALDCFNDRRLIHLAASIEPVPWRVEKYLMRLAFKDRLPESIISRKRTATPWFHRKFFENKSAHRIASNFTFHPLLDDLIDTAVWKEMVTTNRHSQQNPEWYDSQEGIQWFAPLVVDSFLKELKI